MKLIIIVMALVSVMMSGIAGAAVLEEDWAYGKRNVVPEGIEHVYYDFEEGSNCLLPFMNMHPDITSFLTVLGTRPYGCDEPSYVEIGGSTCGKTRSKMYIYPALNANNDGTPKSWIYIVNGQCAFSPITGPDYVGGYWPGTRARIQFNEGTNYVSFLASNGCDLSVRLYSVKGNTYSMVCHDIIPINIYRNGTDPSTFTRFTAHIPNEAIVRMDLYGGFNAWLIDDLIVGAKGRRDYGWAAERLKHLIGVPYNEFGLGFDLYMQDYFTAEEIKDDIPDPYWDKRNKEMLFGEGISDEAAVAWAFNDGGYGELVNWADITDQFNKDFTEEVALENLQPGDVLFIDYPEADGFPDGQIDEVGMYVGDTGFGDIIRITPVFDAEGNPNSVVEYDTTDNINSLYGTDGFVDYRCLPDDPKGGHSPYPKIPTKVWAGFPDYPPLT